MQIKHYFILPSHILLFIIIGLILIIYLKYYVKYNISYKIIQTELANATEDLIYERYPIIISDRIAVPNDLLKTLFKYKYLFHKTFVQYGDPKPRIMYDKYTLLYNNKGDIDINIISPIYRKEANNPINSSNIQFVTIKLKKLQVLVLPSFWMYQTELPHHVIILNDPFSIFISFSHKIFDIRQSNQLHRPSVPTA